jgi:predicted HicB family RNase H-like nuclease
MTDDLDIDTSGLAFVKGGEFGRDRRDDRKKRERASTRTAKQRQRAKERSARESKNKPVNFRTTKTMHAQMGTWAKAMDMSFAELIETAVREYAERKGLTKGE